MAAPTACLDDNEALAYVEHLLPDAARARIAAHLAHCETCLAVTCAIARLDAPTAPGIDESAATPAAIGRSELAGVDDGATPAAIGRYELVEMIGRGGMGAVYIARDPQLDRTIALKVVRSARYAEPAVRARLSREARAMAKVNHANVVTVYDTGELADGVYIAMELVEGGTLADWLLARDRTWREIVEMFVAVGGGLVAAHRAGIVHRDFKPANVLIDATNRPAVTDFGIAIAPDASAPEPRGALAGTPSYMAPEQFRGGAVDERSDQYSYGVALFEALYRVHPFGGATLDELRAAALAGALRAVPDERGVPAAVRAVATRALRTDPHGRYPDMPALLRDLAQALRPPRSRRRAGVAAGGALLAIGAAGIAIALARGGDAPAPARPPSANPIAAAAFDAAVQAERDGNLPAEKRSLDAAIAADPAFAAAYLRLVLYAAAISDESDSSPREAEALAAYHQALDHRAALAPLDAAILDAWEPRFRVPPDRAERSRRFAALAARYPDDARVQAMYGDSLMHSSQLAEAGPPIARALAGDPAYIPAYATSIEIANRNGDAAAARAVADRCIAASASAVSCLQARMTMAYDAGRCADLAADAKQLIAIDPASGVGYTALADAKASLGEPVDSVAEVLRRADTLEPDAAMRHFGELGSREMVDELRGDFADAVRTGDEIIALAPAHPGFDPVGAAMRQLAIVVEEGDLARARTLAARVRSMIDAAAVGDPDINSEAHLATLAHRAGATTHAELHARQDALLALQRADDARRGGTTDPFRMWGWIYGGDIGDAEEAADAKAALAALGGEDAKFADVPFFAQGLGAMYAHAGEGARAIPHLARATASCYQLEEALDLAHDMLATGIAKQAAGDTAGARAAYQAVVDRWGSATPRSVTADRARAALAALPR